MALSGDSLDDVIRPEMREAYYSNYGDWFPRPFCTDHKVEYVTTRMRGDTWRMGECCSRVHKFDMRTPGLFKEEFGGDGIVALNPKTYFCWDENERSKYSSKGLSKRTNQLTRECFLSVLTGKESKTGVNKGFLRKDNKTFTYEQLKTGLTYFYGKRLVLPDGVSTENTRL
jgi:hypothetical protein